MELPFFLSILALQHQNNLDNKLHSKLTTNIANETMQLLSEKAIYMPDHDMLIVSDLHFGKIEHFRKNGIGLPVNAARKDINKLEKLIKAINAKDIVFLGDLFHSDYNNAWPAFKEMLSQFPNKIFHLILGNHDILDESLYNGMELTFKMEISNLTLTHEPMDVITEGKYNICGHIHPGVKLRGKGKQTLRIPCFYFGQHTGILPSFGTFTGTHVIKPVEGDRIFVVKDDVVLEVN
ncbi:MAG: DNA ligase-associated metallophosphoesterase [Saprospiraceae bacterium]